MALFERNGNVLFISRNIGELDEHFYERANFICCQKITHDNNNQYDKYVKYSNIYMNWKYLKSEYGVDVMDELNGMIGNMK